MMQKMKIICLSGLLTGSIMSVSYIPSAYAQDAAAANTAATSVSSGTVSKTTLPTAASIEKVTVLARVFGDGEQAAGAALLYPKTIDASSLSVSDFSVPGKTIMSVMTNDEAAFTDESREGNYVILTFDHKNSVSAAPIGKKNDGGSDEKKDDKPMQRDAPMFSDKQAQDVSITVTQTGDIRATDGTIYAPSSTSVPSSDKSDPVLEKFTQHVFTDPITGESITYDLFLPDGYSKDKTYPLLFFTADASANSGVPEMALLQGNGAMVFASDEEQKKHPTIIVVPEYTPELIRKIGMLTDDTNTWTKGLTLVSNMLFDVIDNYNVDRTRIYGTGQSQGGMTNIALSDKYPWLFAAQYLVACQWNTEEMAAMKDKNLWITVCEGDTKAYPGMNAATALWKSLGSKVVENDSMWDSTLPSAALSQMAEQLAAQGGTINYTVFQGGNHMYTWSFAYDIPYIRDWVFSKTNPNMEKAHHARQGRQKRSLLGSVLLDDGIQLYQQGNYEEAMKYLKAADTYGHMKAGRYVGLLYENGLSVPQDFSTAASWYKRAMDQGDVTATWLLGRLYETGTGVEQNTEKARSLYLRAAQRTDKIGAPAMVLLGSMYERGVGVTQSNTEAESWYEKAAAAGYAPGEVALTNLKNGTHERILLTTMEQGSTEDIQNGVTRINTSGIWTPVTSIDFSSKHNRMIKNDDGTLSPMDEPYFASEQIAPNVWKIRNDGDFCYLIGGDEIGVMVDSGYGAGNLRTYAEKLLGKPVPYVINTHYHFDHTANDSYFDAAFMTAASVPYATVPYASFSGMTFPRNYPVIEVQDGYEMNLGDHQLRILVLPHSNHTLGGLMVLDETNHILFTGDEFLGPNRTDLNISLDDFYNNMAHIAAYRGNFNVMYGGTGKMAASVFDKYYAAGKYGIDRKYDTDASSLPEAAGGQHRQDTAADDSTPYTRGWVRPGDSTVNAPEQIPAGTRVSYETDGFAVSFVRPDSTEN
jgi:predicted peptidase/glyoxylase-like metal-dependent hydrolase (beta-lactamase superfamily II)